MNVTLSTLRSILNPVSLFELSIHDRLISRHPAAVADRFEGAAGVKPGDGVAVGVTVGVGLEVGVVVGVGVGVAVAVAVDVAVGVKVAVGVAVAMGVGVGDEQPSVVAVALLLNPYSPQELNTLSRYV